jgi:hypothetical protein
VAQAFYQSDAYEPLRDRKVRPRPLPDAITFSSAHPAARDAILDYFDEMSVERVGILHGEYVVHPCGVVMADRWGVLTDVCMSLEDSWFAQHLANEQTQPEMAGQIRSLVANWDQLPVVVDPPVLCDPYRRNYFHFSLEMMPRRRYFADGEAAVIMSPDSLELPFQRELTVRCLTGRRVLPLQGGLRVRDPILAHDAMSEEGVHWLREVSGISARPGGRRIFIRRNARVTRYTPGGGLSETAGFQSLLADFGFETVEFGAGENGVAAQVAMLEGVGLILSAHGAALTNLAYLQPELNVVEIMGPRTRSALFMHVAAMLGFRYHGIFSSAYDARHDLIVDLDELRDALHALIRS